MQRFAGLMPSILLVLHLMHRKAGGCLAAKSAMAHASAIQRLKEKPFQSIGVGLSGVQFICSI